MENINFEIFTTKKIEYYRYEISKLKNKEKLSKIDIQILRNSENAISIKTLTRGYCICI